MSMLLVASFPDAWALVCDLEPDVRTLRLLRGVKPPTVHEVTLDPADAARLDLGDYALALRFDGRDCPVVFVVDRAAVSSLIWSCDRGETCWIGATCPTTWCGHRDGIPPRPIAHRPKCTSTSRESTTWPPRRTTRPRRCPGRDRRPDHRNRCRTGDCQPGHRHCPGPRRPGRPRRPAGTSGELVLPLDAEPGGWTQTTERRIVELWADRHGLRVAIADCRLPTRTRVAFPRRTFTVLLVPREGSWLPVQVRNR
jgi:hypothetical protein